MLFQYNEYQDKIFRERAFILDELFGNPQVDRPAIEARLRGIDALEERRTKINRKFRARVMRQLRAVAPDLFDDSDDDDDEEEEVEVPQVPNEVQVQREPAREEDSEDGERSIDFQCCICMEEKDLHETCSLSCHGSQVCNDCAHNNSGPNPICKRTPLRFGVREVWNCPICRFSYTMNVLDE